MKIEKNIPIGNPNTKASFWKEVIEKLEVNESTTFKCNNSSLSADFRVSLSQILKRLKSEKKYCIARWDNENYRVWRTK